MPNSDITLKDPNQEIRLFNSRVLEMGVIIALFIFALVTRLAWLQIFQHKFYVTMSEQNQLDLAPIEPNRGLIYDRNGILLAENIPSFSLNIVPDRTTNLNNTLAELQKIIPISADDIKQFKKQIKQRRRSEPIPIRLHLTDEEVARFSVDQYRFPGVMIKAQLVRHYPLGPTIVTPLGYVGRINEKELSQVDYNNYRATNYIGKIGVEKFYEPQLHGTVGYEQIEADASGRVVRVLKRMLPVHGDNLYLTIDSKLQAAAEQALTGMHGAIVAVDPNNGQVLALVSNPAYDPNLFVNGIRPDEFKALRETDDQPLYNRALRGQYPPGSTVKPFVSLEALDNDNVSPTYGIYDPGWFKLENSAHIFRCHKHSGHGWVNVHSAIIQSCDTYFFNLATKIGIKHIDEALDGFNFGKLTGIDSKEELPGLLPSPQWKKRVHGRNWYPGDSLISIIGQGYMLATPLQLAEAVATMSMRGKAFQPQLVLKIQKSNGKIIDKNPIPLPTVAYKEETWDTVLNAMHDVATNPSGTAYKYYSQADFDLGAKTGTAQVFGLKQNEKYNAKMLPEKLRDHSLFIAFAPYAQPKIAISVVVENSTQPAAMVAHKVMDSYFGIKPKPLAPLPVASKTQTTASDTSDDEETHSIDDIQSDGE